MKIIAISKSSWIFSPRQRTGGSKSTSAAPPVSARPIECSKRAHQLRAEGHDVVLGFIETHGRAETAARMGDLECVPLKKISYRGVILEEMDVDAILARKPQFAVVDELPHTNVAGSKHSRRYQD